MSQFLLTIVLSFSSFGTVHYPSHLSLRSLKTQITNLGGTVGGGGEGGGALTETERRSVQERLGKVQGELDSKRVAVKNLKLALEKIDITE